MLDKKKLINFSVHIYLRQEDTMAIQNNIYIPVNIKDVDPTNDLHCFNKIASFNYQDLESLELKPTKTDTLYIKTMSGRTIECKMNSLETVDSLNRFIAEIEGVPVDHQRLIFAGKQLETGHFLSDYNIKNGDCVSLILRLRGGMHNETSNGGCVALPSTDLECEDSNYDRQLMIQLLMCSLTTDEEFDLIDMADSFRVEDD